MKNFKDILKDLSVTGITADSRAVAPGSLFVAVKGGTQDGHRFAGLAEKAGAVGIVGEDEAFTLSVKLKIPYFQVPDSRKALALLAAEFQGHPSHQMKM